MPEPITTLTAWKRRLQVGVQIRQISNFSEGATGHIFTVGGVQTQAVWGTRAGEERRRWLYFIKRSEIEFTEKGWRRIDKGNVIAEYEWVIPKHE